MESNIILVLLYFSYVNAKNFNSSPLSALLVTISGLFYRKCDTSSYYYLYSNYLSVSGLGLVL